MRIVRKTDLGNTKFDVSANACQLDGWIGLNGNASVVYLQLYDGLAANVVLGTTVPVATIPVTASALTICPDVLSGLIFKTALCVVTSTALDGTGAPGATSPINFVLR